MEAHERDKINKNLYELIQDTTCSVTFLAFFEAREILSRDDVETITVAKQNQGSRAQAKRFYEIIQTKVGAYGILLQVLRETSQSGALQILENEAEDTSRNTTRILSYVKAPKFLLEFLNSSIKAEDTSRNTSRILSRVKVPKFLLKFFNPRNRGTTLVISTHDSDITCQRIVETVKDIRLFKMADFIDYISSNTNPSTRDNTTPVINCEKDWKKIRNTLSFSQKKVFVTNLNDLDDIREMLHCPSKKSVCYANDELEWDDLSASLQTKVHDTLEQLHLPDECVAALPDVKGKALIDLIKGKSPTLFKDTLPEPLRYYVPRKIITRNVICKSVFSTDGPDIFLIKGVERHELSELANGKQTETSSNIMHTNDDSVKCVRLDHEKHFDIIAAKFQHRPVHVLSRENGKFFWLKSSGGIHTIQQAVHSDQIAIPEKDFLQNILPMCSFSQSLVCLSETPGMGKSVLLAQFGRSLLEAETDSLTQGSVAFVLISDLVKSTKNSSAQTDLSERVFLALASAICENELGVAFFRKNKSNLKNLLLDGLDEIMSEEVELGYQVLTNIREQFPDTRVWVTTRPHMFDQLEKTFNVLGYNIQPFDEDDQIHFLDLFWSHSVPEIGDQSKLPIFAKNCLKSLKSSMSSESSETIAGVPLQCLLIAEVFEEDAGMYCETKNSELLVGSIKTVADLYEQLVKKKFEIYFQKYDNGDFNFVQLLQTHYYLSIMLLFPEFVKILGPDFTLPANCLDQIVNVGILESKCFIPAPRFIHRTFAEFFVAKYLVECLTPSMTKSQFHLLIQVLQTLTAKVEVDIWHSLDSRKFKYNVICYFINAQLESTNNYTLPNDLTIELPDLANILHACVYSDFESIFLGLLRSFEAFQRNIASFVTQELLMLCVATAGRSTVTQLFKLFTAVNSTPLTKIRIQDYTLLHIAVICGNYSAFEFLLGNEAIKDSFVSTNEDFLFMLHDCVEDSMFQSEKVVNQKCEIVKRLMKLDFKLENFPVVELSAIYLSNVNMKLLVLLLQPVSSAKDEHVIQRILHKATKVYNCSDYQQLIRHVKSTSGLDCVTKCMNDSFKGKPLINNILEEMKCDITMLQFLKDNGLNFALRKNDLQGFFESVVKQNVECLEWLVNNCADLINDTPTYFWISYNQSNYSHCWFLLDKKLVHPTSFNKANESWFNRFISNKRKVTLEMCQLAQYFVKNGVDIETVHEDSNSALKLFFKTEPTQHTLQFLKIFHISWNSPVFVLEKLKWIIQLGCVGELGLDQHLSSFIKENEINSDVDNEGNTLLHLAAEHRNNAALKHFLRSGASVNTKNTKGETALHKLFSIYESEFPMECWKTLIDHDADPTILHNDNETPISTHTWTIKLSAVQYAIRHFQSIDFPKSCSIFLLSCRRLSLLENKDLCEWYTGSIKTPIKDIRGDFKGEHMTLLDVVLRRYDGDLLEYFMQELGCTELTKSIDALIYDGEFAFNGCPGNAFKFVQIINNMYPGVFNRPNKYGFYSLSVKGIHWDYVQPIVSVGADVNCTDSYGNTPLHWALKHDVGYTGFLVESLIDAGADVNAVTSNGKTPLFLAINLRQQYIQILRDTKIRDCVKLLIDNEADATKKDSFGNTILHLLLPKLDISDFFEIVEHLLENDQSELLQIPDKNGLTPIQIAKQYSCINSRLSKLLLKYGISI